MCGGIWSLVVSGPCLMVSGVVWTMSGIFYLQEATIDLFFLTTCHKVWNIATPPEVDSDSYFFAKLNFILGKYIFSLMTSWNGQKYKATRISTDTRLPWSFGQFVFGKEVCGFTKNLSREKWWKRSTWRKKKMKTKWGWWLPPWCSGRSSRPISALGGEPPLRSNCWIGRRGSQCGDDS